MLKDTERVSRSSVTGFRSLSTVMCFIPKADKRKLAPQKGTPSLRSESSEKPRESPRIGLRTQGQDFSPASRPCPGSLRLTSVRPRVLVLGPAPLEAAANRGAANRRLWRAPFLPAPPPPAVTCPAPQPRDSNSRKRRPCRRV